MSDPGARYVTVEDLERMHREDADLEIWDGRLVVREASGGWPSGIGVVLGVRVFAHVQANRLGWVADASAGYVLRRGPDRFMSPDLSFTSRDRLPAWPETGFFAVVPDLVAEVRSPSDSWTHVAERGGIWIAHGVRVVWLVDPRRRRVVTLRPGEVPVESGLGGSFSGDPALPGFTMTVDDLFRPFLPESAPPG